MRKFLILAITLLSLSCTPPAYFPSKQIPPRLSKDGNVQASIGIGSSMEYTYQVSASPVEHIALYYSGLGVIPKWTSYKHRQNEFGGGFYFYTGTKYYVGAFGGYSLGTVDAKSSVGRVENKYRQYSGIIAVDSKNTTGYLNSAIRLDYHLMRDYKRSEKVNGVMLYSNSEDLKNIFIGPSIGRTFVSSSGSIQLQLGASFPVRRSEQDIYLFGSAGILFDFQFW